MCGVKEILLKNVRVKGNPIEILEKTSQSEPHPSPRPRDPWKSWKKPHNLIPILAPAPGTSGNPGKTSQFADHPLDLRKSWKKPHNLSPILAPAPGTPGNPGKNLTICGPSPGPPEILEKTSQSADHPRDRLKSWKKTSQYYGFACWLLVVVPTSCAEAPTLRGQSVPSRYCVQLDSLIKPPKVSPIPGTA